MSKRKESVSKPSAPGRSEKVGVVDRCAVKGTLNKSAVPRAMNVIISPAVNNAILSEPQATAGINLLKH